MNEVIDWDEWKNKWDGWLRSLYEMSEWIKQICQMDEWNRWIEYMDEMNKANGWNE